MGTETPVREATGDRTADLAAGESDIAGRAVFAWVLVPAAGRMVHELAEGHDAHDAIEELRAAVRLLDRLGWPDDESGATRLNPDEAAVVRVAARSQLGRGVNPDRAARGRVARGHTVDLPPAGALGAVLDALERGLR
ncbi:MAG TPA: hypothetical protein PKD59_00465 [Miltoncostaeaceae bacterium]|nr:hypothetical protein [Miltoncostaeaceae bacterium]